MIEPIRDDAPLYVLWKHMVDEHDLTLGTSQLDEIVILASRCGMERTCNWYKAAVGCYESCDSVHQVSSVDGVDVIPAYCESCGGRVVVE